MPRGNACGLIFKEAGTMTGSLRCDFCHRRGLAEMIVLEAFSEDGEVLGHKYACHSCADTLRLDAGPRAVADPFPAPPKR